MRDINFLRPFQGVSDTDWPWWMPDWRWQTETADYRLKCRCQTNFFSAFRHLLTIFRHYSKPAVYGRAEWIPVHHHQYGRSGCLFTNSSMEHRVSLHQQQYEHSQGVFPPPAVWTCRMSLYHQQYGRTGCHSTNSSMNIQGLFPPPPAVYMDVQGVTPPTAIWTFMVSIHYTGINERAGCKHFHLLTVFVNLDCPVPESKRMQIAEPARYRNKGTQSSIRMLRYQTEMSDAGMPMPAASALMPMPSCGHRFTYF